jgi:protein-disulfide isomerase
MNRPLETEISAADHLRGSLGAPARLVIYGDYECPYTRKAMLEVARLREDLGDSLVFVFRNFPLTEIHPHALHAALAAEAADGQGKFWEMNDLLFRRQNFLGDQELVAYASLIGLDQERFRADLEAQSGLARIDADVQSGERSGVDGTPGIFVNGRRYLKDYDAKTLAAALTAAAAPGRPR